MYRLADPTKVVEGGILVLLFFGVLNVYGRDNRIVWMYAGRVGDFIYPKACDDMVVSAVYLQSSHVLLQVIRFK